MKKQKSRIEVLNNDFKLQPILPTDELVLQKETYTENGRVFTRMVQKTVFPAERMSNFKVSDFCTENLVAIGAKDHFRPMSPLPTSDIDSALYAMEHLSSIYDSARASSAASAQKPAQTPSTETPSTQTTSTQTAS